MSLEAMESGEIVVYGVAKKLEYIARFDELGWVQWPAKDGGWAERKSGKEADVDPRRTLPAENARLALRLSGVTL
jgi:hypothetical protein